MTDIDGNVVDIGDLVRVLAIDQHWLDHVLADDEREQHRAMLHHVFVVDDIVDDGLKASVTICWDIEDGIATGGLHLLPHECRLVQKGGQSMPGV